MERFKIIQVGGTDAELYPLVGPLVMNPAVLRQNFNFPFRTSEKFRWFIALDCECVAGFIPLERKRSESVINNYYIAGKKADVLRRLVQEVIAEADEQVTLSAIAFLEDKELFEELGFKQEKLWTRYAKMVRTPQEPKKNEAE